MHVLKEPFRLKLSDTKVYELTDPDRVSQFENKYFMEMCSGFKAGSYLRLIDFVYHSTLGWRLIKKRRRRHGLCRVSNVTGGARPCGGFVEKIGSYRLHWNRWVSRNVAKLLRVC
jgi:hypothetical protein